MCYSGSTDNYFCFIIKVWVTKDTRAIGRDLVVFALVFPQTAVQTKCNQVFFPRGPCGFLETLAKGDIAGQINLEFNFLTLFYFTWCFILVYYFRCL